ncbi:MAG TPA: hypothetical protein DDX01_04585 [Holosporales bacterium]|nr:MAG: hypothetical protein A2W06_04040 [Alphaproteobacteria bacterium RBG_16_42_14]OFW92602.1 MAG: hypothetical protein A3C41_07515 [Alphaproteobacteria bacterium RIFCSPHIGHO2_02_FULL_42_30]HBG34617.1 hypothetical protein [Holosporales bacterium]
MKKRKEEEDLVQGQTLNQKDRLLLVLHQQRIQLLLGKKWKSRNVEIAEVTKDFILLVTIW